MCFASKPNTSAVQQTVPQPEQTAEPTQIGQTRKAEDTSLFGGVPDLRVDRTTPAAVTNAGSGLALM
jgi:hypothetical protein